ncbi:MAG: response regulator [Novosphingobium sp.]|nr:response regulator [Novosphingobium sp.]
MTIRILHVDDEPDIREIVGLALELDPRFEVVAAPSGAEGLERLDEGGFNLVLLDMMMPEMDGPATFAAMRERSMGNVPVVFMTARAQAEQSEKLIALDAVGVIAKPFDPLTLASELEAFLP